MPELELLNMRHEEAVFAFERANRTYFAASVSDRGDAFFDEFDARFREALAEQEAGRSAFYVLVDGDGDGDGAVLGRFNLYDLAGGVARLGYRVAEHVAGRGVATAAVRELGATAVGLGLRTLVAATTEGNVASRAVLLKAGFVPVGPADPAELGGKRGTRYRLDLTERARA